MTSAKDWEDYHREIADEHCQVGDAVVREGRTLRHFRAADPAERLVILGRKLESLLLAIQTIDSAVIQVRRQTLELGDYLRQMKADQGLVTEATPPWPTRAEVEEIVAKTRPVAATAGPVEELLALFGACKPVREA